MWRDFPCDGYHFWLIPSNGGKFEIIAYTHVVFKLMSTPLFFEMLRSFSKIRNKFSFSSKLIVFKVYKIFYDPIWNLPIWNPIINCPRVSPMPAYLNNLTIPPQMPMSSGENRTLTNPVLQNLLTFRPCDL